jgi:hypothetical protein
MAEQAALRAAQARLSAAVRWLHARIDQGRVRGSTGGCERRGGVRRDPGRSGDVDLADRRAEDMTALLQSRADPFDELLTAAILADASNRGQRCAAPRDHHPVRGRGGTGQDQGRPGVRTTPAATAIQPGRHSTRRLISIRIQPGISAEQPRVDKLDGRCSTESTLSFCTLAASSRTALSALAATPPHSMLLVMPARSRWMTGCAASAQLPGDHAAVSAAG